MNVGGFVTKVLKKASQKLKIARQLPSVQKGANPSKLKFKTKKGTMLNDITHPSYVQATRASPYDNSQKVYGVISYEKEKKILRRDEDNFFYTISLSRGVGVGKEAEAEVYQALLDNLEIYGSREPFQKIEEIELTKETFPRLFPEYLNTLARIYRGDFRFTPDGLNNYLDLNPDWARKIKEQVAIHYLVWSLEVFGMIQEHSEVEKVVTTKEGSLPFGGTQKKIQFRPTKKLYNSSFTLASTIHRYNYLLDRVPNQEEVIKSFKQWEEDWIEHPPYEEEEYDYEEDYFNEPEAETEEPLDIEEIAKLEEQFQAEEAKEAEEERIREAKEKESVKEK